MRALLLDLWREHGFGVLLVTHDVDEAVALADRVLVLEAGRVVHTLRIDEPRRPPGDPVANTERYRAELLDRARRPALTSPIALKKGTRHVRIRRAVIIRRAAVLAMLAGLLAGCVSRQADAGCAAGARRRCR